MKSMNDERFLGVATESWPEWGLNPGPLNYYVYKWSEVIHDTQSAQISQKQDGHNTQTIMCPSVTVHHLAKCMSCQMESVLSL